MPSIRAGLCAWVWVWAVGLSLPCHAGNTYTVGGDIDCDFASIQDAVDAFPLDGYLWANIRIARSKSYTGIAVDLDGASVNLSGGWDNCSDTASSGRTVLSGSGGTADAVIDIFGSAAQVRLLSLSISGGDPSAGNFGGGIQILGDSQVFLQNVTVSSNHSDRGGGIYVDGGLGATVTIDEDSSVFSNSASQSGGGIYCVNVAEPQFVRMEGDLFDNEAVNGGGVYLDNCTLIHVAMNTGDGIFFNRATGSGGGAYLANGASLILDGEPRALSVLSLNSASLDGGGLYLTGNSSRAIGSGAELIDNSAGRDGGGIFLDSGSASLSTGGCSLERCSRLESNLANGQGGAVYQLGGDLSLRGTWVLDNSSPDGSLIKSEGGTSYFENIIAAGNRDATAVMRLKNGAAEIYNSTFADNQDMSSTLLLTGGSLTLKGSIIWESSGNSIDFFGAATTTSYDCLLVHNFPALITRISFSDPLFIDPSSDNYHLQMASPAVDFCFNVLGPGIKGPIIGPVLDIDGDQRGFDIPTVPNEFGPYDLGADEWVDRIFSDGFEFLSMPIR